MDPTTQFYIDETMTIMSYNPEAQAAISQLQSTLQRIAMEGVLAGVPNGTVYARYCADTFIINGVSATVVPEQQRYGQFIGIDNPPPPPPGSQP